MKLEKRGFDQYFIVTLQCNKTRKTKAFFGCLFGEYLLGNHACLLILPIIM